MLSPPLLLLSLPCLTGRSGGPRRVCERKPATWGEIVVESGRLLYVLEDVDGLGFVLGPGIVGTVAPERPHHVTSQGPVRFFVRFLRP